jgi:death on curing protein
MDIKTLSIDVVIDIHEDMLIIAGGLPGLSKNKSLEAALYRIDTLIFYENVTDLFEIAAQYGIALAQGHVFNDGNKRTALISMYNFLAINNFTLVMREKDALDMMDKIAMKKISRTEVAEILKRWSHEYRTI